MSLIQMLQSLEEENNNDIEQILAAAKKESEKILFLARIKGEDEAHIEEQAGKEKIKRETGVIVNRALASRRQKIASVKQEIFDSVVQEVLDRLLSFHCSASYEEELRALYLEARAGFEKSTQVKVTVSDKDATLMTKILSELGDSAEVMNGEVDLGGLLLATLDNKMIIDNSIRKRLDTVLAKGKPELAKLLFGEAP